MGIGKRQRNATLSYYKIDTRHGIPVPLNQHPQTDKVAKTEALDTCLCSRVVCFISAHAVSGLLGAHIYIVSIIIDHNIYAKFFPSYADIDHVYLVILHRPITNILTGHTDQITARKMAFPKLF